MGKAFEEWKKTREEKTTGFLTTQAAYAAGEECGWKGAINKLSDMLNPWAIDKENVEIIYNFIQSELEENIGT